MVSRSFSRFSHAMDTKRVRMDGSVSPQPVEDKASKKASDSTVERYKAHLHAIFDGKKPLPDHIRGLQTANSEREEAALLAAIEPDLVDFAVFDVEAENFFDFREQTARQLVVHFRQQLAMNDVIGANLAVRAIAHFAFGTDGAVEKRREA